MNKKFKYESKRNGDIEFFSIEKAGHYIRDSDGKVLTMVQLNQHYTYVSVLRRQRAQEYFINHNGFKIRKTKV